MTDWETRLTVSGIICLTLSTYLGISCTTASWGCFFLTGIISVILLLCGGFSLHAASLKPASSLTLWPLMKTYFIFNLAVPMIAKIMHKKLLVSTKDPQKHQDEGLMKILTENGQTAFGRDYELYKIRNRQEFVKKFPLTNFDVYEKYSERTANGEENVMTKAKLIQMCASSGTTGKNKLYPLTDADLPLLKRFALSYLHILYQVYQTKLMRELDFHMYHPVTKTKGGIKIGGVASARRDRRPNWTSPTCISKIDKEGPSYFVQSIFGLREPDVGVIQGTSSDLMYAFFKSMEFNKEALYNTISTGHIDSFPGLGEEVRQELNQQLIPDPDRAKKFLKEIEKGSAGFAQRIWPGLKSVLMGRTGSFANSAKILENSYLKNVTIVFGMHPSTEGILGASVSTEDIAKEEYTFNIEGLFFEFIKVEEMEDDQPKTYLLSELEVGQMYEVIVTNWNGLYRNRFGDVVKIVGFTNNTPKYIFQYRTGQILNCAYDRTPEKVFYDALLTAAQEWKIEIINYTSTESMHIETVTGEKARKNHYVAFIETPKDAILANDHEEVLEQKLQDLQQTYAEYRDQDSVGPVKIIQVVQGTFDGLRSVLWGNRPNLQYKTPRVLRNQKALVYLWNNKL